MTITIVTPTAKLIARISFLVASVVSASYDNPCRRQPNSLTGDITSLAKDKKFYASCIGIGLCTYGSVKAGQLLTYWFEEGATRSMRDFNAYIVAICLGCYILHKISNNSNENALQSNAGFDRSNVRPALRVKTY